MRIQEYNCGWESHAVIPHQQIYKPTMTNSPNQKAEEEFFQKLAEELEDLFPKGELCECGERLPCRSKALAFNGMANVFCREALASQKQQIIEGLEGRKRGLNWLTGECRMHEKPNEFCDCKAYNQALTEAITFIKELKEE